MSFLVALGPTVGIAGLVPFAVGRSRRATWWQGASARWHHHAAAHSHEFVAGQGEAVVMVSLQSGAHLVIARAVDRVRVDRPTVARHRHDMSRNLVVIPPCGAYIEPLDPRLSGRLTITPVRTRRAVSIERRYVFDVCDRAAEVLMPPPADV